MGEQLALAERIFESIVRILIPLLGPVVLKERIDQWAAADSAFEAAKLTKFGPPK